MMLDYINKSIDRRITFFVVLIMLLGISVGSFFSYRVLYEDASQKLEQTALLQTKSISAEVEDLFENASIVTEQLSYNKEISNYLYEVKTRDDIQNHPLYKTVRSALVEIKDNSQYHSAVWVANISASFYFDDIGNASDHTYEIKRRPWYDVAVNSHKVAFTQAYHEWSTDETIISAVKALRNSGEIYGFVAVDVMINSIPEVFYNHRLGYDESFYLISETGDYVYHPDITELDGESILDSEDLLEPFKGIVFQGSGAFEEVEMEGRQMFLLSYPVALANWRVVTLIDKGVLFSDLRDLFFMLLIMMSFTFLVSTALIRYIVKKQMKPFGMLVGFGHDITQGNLERNIPYDLLEREDDMGVLSKSFQLIIDAFRNEKEILEARIEEKNKALKDQYDYILETEKAASLGDVVSGIAHEINTPLGNSVASLSYLSKINEKTKDKLVEGKLSREDLVKYIGEVDKSIALLDGNLSRTVDLIENFKMISVNQDDTLEMVNICNIISMVAVSLKQEIKQGNHHFQNNCSDLIEIESYGTAWLQIFTNIIQNSLQHGFAHKERGVIDIECYLKDDIVNVIYKDDGAGISREDLKSIYDPFFTTTRNQGNVGLGMSIVFNLVNHKLGGSIKVSSFNNKGITILIKVPKK